jgi:hydrogenase maturation factor
VLTVKEQAEALLLLRELVQAVCQTLDLATLRAANSGARIVVAVDNAAEFLRGGQ